MTQPQLEELRREFERDGIGELLLRELWHVVRAHAPLRPASVYAGESAWTSEALADALQGWVAKRLVGRGDLGGLLRKSLTPLGFRRALATSFTQYLSNEAASGSSARLYQRVRKLLAEDDAFEHVEGAAEKGAGRWSLAGTPTAPSEMRLEALVRVAHERTDEELGVVRYAPGSLKADPILRKPALRDFMIRLLERAGGSLSLEQIHDVLWRRFNLGLHEPTGDPDDVAELEDRLPEDTPGPLEVAERRDIARSALARASGGDVAVVQAIHRAAGDVNAAAIALGREPADLVEAYTRVLALLAEASNDETVIEDLYDELLEMLFPENGEGTGC